MKRRNFCVALAFAASLVTTTVIGCTSQSSSDTQVLRMATDANYPPYEFFDTASGSQDPIGFDIDIATYITQKLGYELEIMPMEFKGVIPALQSKRADFAMAGITPTDERKQSVDFSDIYYEAKNTIVVKQGSSIQSLEGLNGKVLGVKLGTTQEQTAKKITEQVQNVTLKTLDDLGPVIQEIKAGRMDAAIMEETVAKGFLKNNPDLAYFSIEIDPQGSAIAFPKDSPLAAEFNTVLQEMKTNGELDKLIQKWFEDYYKS